MLDAWAWEKPVKLIAGIMIAASVVAPWTTDARWVAVASPVWAIAGLAGWIAAGRRRRAARGADLPDGERDAVAQRESGKEMLGLLNHYRHDWMNDLQVLYGYARMQKHDLLLPYIEKIRDRSATESALSRLGVPSLMKDLLRFRNQAPDLVLFVSFMSDCSSIADSPLAQVASRVIVGVLEGFREAAEPGRPAELTLTMNGSEEEMALLFEFSGGYRQDTLKDRVLAAAGNDPAVSWDAEYSEGEADIELRIARSAESL